MYANLTPSHRGLAFLHYSQVSEYSKLQILPTETGLYAVWIFEKLLLSFTLLLIENKQIRTFSKAHIAKSYC
jgi:hypothetical protein